MSDPSWSRNLLQSSLFFVVLFTFATGMALTSRSRKDTTAVLTNPSEDEPWRPYYISYSCEWTFLRITCPRARTINVVRAIYGRQNLNYCPHMRAISGLDWETPCTGIAGKSRRIVASMCNGKPTCLIPVFNGLFGDPCPSTHKYLEVYYACA